MIMITRRLGSGCLSSTAHEQQQQQTVPQLENARTGELVFVHARGIGSLNEKTGVCAANGQKKRHTPRSAFTDGVLSEHRRALPMGNTMGSSHTASMLRNLYSDAAKLSGSVMMYVVMT
jgi:hypothetical protein